MKYIFKKLITLIITLLFISFITFMAFSVIPGDAVTAKLGTNATPEQAEALREQMGLNDPLPTRYARWLVNALHGEFGESYQYNGVSVSSLMADRLPVTATLAVISLVIILVFSIPIGILSARYAGRWLDTLIAQLSQITMAVPAFFLGILLTYIFGLILRWFQPGAFIDPKDDLWGCISYMIFPAIAVALPKIAMVVKFLRNSILSEVGKDYVRTAYSKGNRRNRVLYVHILRNALIPVLTFVAMIVAEIMTGSIIVEQVFGLPGMGRLLVTSISVRDFPVVQAVVTYVTSIVVIVNFIVDVLYQLVDPRVQAE